MTADHNKNLVLSARNIPGMGVAHVGDINCLEILRHQWIVIEKQAVDRLTGAAS